MLPVSHGWMGGFKRHGKIQKAAHPYDPAWELSFRKASQRHGPLNTSTGNEGYAMLWQEQHGHGPVCHTLMTEETGWHNHHIIWALVGGHRSNGRTASYYIRTAIVKSIVSD